MSPKQLNLTRLPYFETLHLKVIMQPYSHILYETSTSKHINILSIH